MKQILIISLTGALLGGGLSACIGTDVVDDIAAEMMPDAAADSTDSPTTDPPVAAGNERSGQLEGRGGYDARGTVTLSRNDDGELLLTTSEDFSVTLALGTFLYLSNSQAGGATAADGLEVADVSERLEGAQTYNVSALNGNVDLDTYQYVVVLCKPARITFGLAELN